MNNWVKTAGAGIFGLGTGTIVGTVLASSYLALAYQTPLDAFDPMAVWKLTDLDWLRRPNASKVASWALGLTALGFGTLAMAWTFQRQRKDYGTAHWQSKGELKNNKMLGYPGKGFVLGKLNNPKSPSPYVVSQTVPHVMVTAPTRAGKGVGFVIPNLLAFQGSTITLDVKGENFDRTAKARAEAGDEVYRFAPFDWENATHRYNPLDRIVRCNSFDQMFTELSILADLFLDKSNQGNDTFVEAGKSIFVAACLTAIQNGKPTLGEVNRIVSGGEDKNKQYSLYAKLADNPTHKMLWEDAASTSSKLLTSNIQALKTAGLKQWDNPKVCRATEATDFNFGTFRSKPQSLYLCVSEDHIKTLKPLLRLIFADLIATIRLKEPGAEEPFPVMMMIDEFQQMGAMPFLETAIHTLASYGGRVAMIVQSLAALDKIYGKEGRQGLENGAGLRLFMTPREELTVGEVSAAVGKTTKEAVSRTFSKNRGLLGSTSLSSRAEERPLLSETDARTLDPNKIIILAPPQHPIMVQKIQWFEDPVFTKIQAAAEARTAPYPSHDRETSDDKKAEFRGIIVRAAELLREEVQEAWWEDLKTVDPESQEKDISSEGSESERLDDDTQAEAPPSSGESQNNWYDDPDTSDTAAAETPNNPEDRGRETPLDDDERRQATEDFEDFSDKIEEKKPRRTRFGSGRV